MRRWIDRSKISVLFLFVLLFGAASVAAEEVQYLSTEAFRTRIYDFSAESVWKYKGDKPCVIDFYTVWCRPCKLLAPILEELSEEYCDQVLFYRSDTEREWELAYFFGINTIPQILFIPLEGKPMMLTGLYPREYIVQIIEEVLLQCENSEKEE